MNRTAVLLLGLLSAAIAGCGGSSPTTPAGDATRLEFSGVPAAVEPGVAFALSVRAVRDDLTLDTGFTGAVTISVMSGPGALTGTLTRNASAGVAQFSDLSVDAAGNYALTAVSGALSTASAAPLVAATDPPVVLWTGTFTGQNGYVTSGSFDIERVAGGAEVLRTRADFRVSGGAGSISVWLTDAAGAANLNASSVKIKLGTITSGFQGVYEWPTGGTTGYTHVVTFCDGARVNFGFAALASPVPAG